MWSHITLRGALSGRALCGRALCGRLRRVPGTQRGIEGDTEARYTMVALIAPAVGCSGTVDRKPRSKKLMSIACDKDKWPSQDGPF